MCLCEEMGSARRGVGSGSYSMWVKGLGIQLSESRSGFGPGGYLCFQAMTATGRPAQACHAGTFLRGPVVQHMPLTWGLDLSGDP